jgi:thiol:disulfide interchange protein DsbD
MSYVKRVTLTALFSFLTALFIATVPLRIAAEFSSGSLIGEMRAVTPGSSFLVALRLELQDGWHTYWRNPGDSGQPAVIAWTFPPGFRASEILWPSPDRFPYGEFMNFGYEGEVLLPVEISVPEHYPAGQNFTLRAEARWLVCRDICISEQGVFEIDILCVKDDVQTDARWNESFARVRGELPVVFPEVVGFEFDVERLSLTIPRDLLSDQELMDIWLYPYEWGIIDHAAEQKITVSSERGVLAVRRGELPDTQIRAFEGVLVFEERVGEQILKRAYSFSALAGWEGDR